MDSVVDYSREEPRGGELDVKDQAGMCCCKLADELAGVEVPHLRRVSRRRGRASAQPPRRLQGARELLQVL
jgi:hypothetical protein